MTPQWVWRRRFTVPAVVKPELWDALSFISTAWESSSTSGSSFYFEGNAAVFSSDSAEHAQYASADDVLQRMQWQETETACSSWVSCTDLLTDAQGYIFVDERQHQRITMILFTIKTHSNRTRYTGLKRGRSQEVFRSGNRAKGLMQLTRRLCKEVFINNNNSLIIFNNLMHKYCFNYFKMKYYYWYLLLLFVSAAVRSNII